MKSFGEFVHQLNESYPPQQVLAKVRDAIQRYVIGRPETAYSTYSYRIKTSDTQKALQALEKAFGRFKLAPYHHIFEKAGVRITLERADDDSTYSSVNVLTF